MVGKWLEGSPAAIDLATELADLLGCSAANVWHRLVKRGLLKHVLDAGLRVLARLLQFGAPGAYPFGRALDLAVELLQRG